MSSFLDRLNRGKEQYDKDQQGSTKRRRFVPGMEIRGRLMPFEHDAGDGEESQLRFIETFYNHYFESSQGDGWVFLACPKNNKDWDCACSFCDPMKAHYEQHGSDNVYNMYKRKRKYKCNFVVTGVDVLDKYTVSDEDLGLWKEIIGVPTIVDFPYAIKEKVDTAMGNPEIGMAIWNPENGYDLIIRVTLKKTDSGDQHSYNTTDFARTATKVEGGLKLLEQCANIVEHIETLKKADLERIPKVAAAEGLIASTGAAPSESSRPADKSNSAGSASSSNGGQAEDTTEQKEDASAGDGEGDSLANIFNKYRS